MTEYKFYVRFVDSYGFEDFVNNVWAINENEAIVNAKKYLFENGLMDSNEIKLCTNWEAEWD